MAGKAEETTKLPEQTTTTEAPPPPTTEEETKKYGTHVMGAPSVPTAHPDNQAAASWKASDHQHISQQPYIVYSPIESKPSNNPLEPVVDMFNSWTRRAETVARNIWHNCKSLYTSLFYMLCFFLYALFCALFFLLDFLLNDYVFTVKTGNSVSEAAWGKVNLTAKAITEGGFESLFKQIFQTEPNEKLKKTFACYLSTTTGPVAGTLYLSTLRVGFCSDRPLSFTAPSGQETWSYYKVMIPLANISTVNPVTMKENPLERYINIGTVDGHEFWFMGFVNFEKASENLSRSVSEFRGSATVAGY